MKRGNYTKHINHAVTCAVCGKPFGASRSTAKYCGERCRRLAYYAKMGFLGTIKPTRIKVLDPKIELAKMRDNAPKVETKVETQKEWRIYGYVVAKTNRAQALAVNGLISEFCAKNGIQSKIKANSHAQNLSDNNFRLTLFEPDRETRLAIKKTCPGLGFSDTEVLMCLETYGDLVTPKQIKEIEPYTFILDANFKSRICRQS